MKNNFYQTPEKYFYRCAFPRSRMFRQIEDDLTLFVQLISDNAHKKKEQFESDFDNRYRQFHSGEDKTIKNHRTEMIRLFGLAIVTEDGYVEPTDRTLMLVESQDYYQFFKIFCMKMQFPNCINKPQITKEELELGVKFKPAKFILKLMLEGKEKYGSRFAVSGSEISHLVFNDLRVTRGQIAPNECLDILVKNRNAGVRYKGGSYLTQHGREFMQYLVLANLMVYNEDDNSFQLNFNEKESIDFILQDDEPFQLPIDFATNPEVRVQTYANWSLWYGSVNDTIRNILKTSVKSYDKFVKAEIPSDITIEKEGVVQPLASALKNIGDIGEGIVLKYERDTIKKIRPDKIGLIQKVSNDTSLGFDIQSLEFNDVSTKKFIEVKTTNRTFPPNIDILTSFPMSGNEWETAKTYGNHYYIYRVFLISNSYKVFAVKNPCEKERQGMILLEPMEYRVILKRNCGKFLA